MNLKKNSRQQLIQQRNRLNPQERFNLSQQIRDKLLSSDVFKQSETIALYMCINNEVDLSPLLTLSKKIVLPVIQSNNTMTFNHFDSLDSLEQNKFGILEPKNNTVIKPEYIDLCLMPLVGFNRKGHRVGMGGGYYDRYFALNHMHRKPTILAGIAYDFQEDDTISAQSWDIPLDMIFTNKETIII